MWVSLKQRIKNLSKNRKLLHVFVKSLIIIDSDPYSYFDVIKRLSIFSPLPTASTLIIAKRGIAEKLMLVRI